MATLKDVAKHAEVSAMTVSHVVNGTKSVSPVVKERVLASIAKLNYRPNRSARALRTKRNATLGLIVPDLTNPFFPKLVESLEKEARHYGYATLLISSNRDASVEKQSFDVLLQHGVDGVIWCPDNPYFQPTNLPFPMVVIDRPLAAFDSVSADHYAGGMKQGHFAIEQGHTRIGVLKGPQNFTNAKQRYEGLIAGLGAIEPVWQFEVPFSFSVGLPFEVTEAFRAADASLIVAVNDVVAIAALRTLHELGRRVPDEVSLFGFDDTPWALLVHPSLTTIRQPVAELAAYTINMLLARIDKPDREIAHVTRPVELVVRQSTAERRQGAATVSIVDANKPPYL